MLGAAGYGPWPNYEPPNISNSLCTWQTAPRRWTTRRSVWQARAPVQGWSEVSSTITWIGGGDPGRVSLPTRAS